MARKRNPLLQEVQEIPSEANAVILEKGYSLSESFKILCKNLNAAAVGTGLVATLFSTLGPGVIVMNAAKQGGLTEAQAVSWLLGIYAFGGLATMFVSLRYRIPLVVAYSIPGAILLGKLLARFSLSQAVGAYMVVGLVTLILTLTGAIKKVVDHIPGPVMLGMVGGVLLSFGSTCSVPPSKAFDLWDHAGAFPGGHGFPEIQPEISADYRSHDCGSGVAVLLRSDHAGHDELAVCSAAAGTALV